MQTVKFKYMIVCLMQCTIFYIINKRVQRVNSSYVVKSKSSCRCTKCIVCCSVQVVRRTPSDHCECVKYVLRLHIRIAPAGYNYHHAELNNFIIIITIIIHNNIVFDNLNVSLLYTVALQVSAKCIRDVYITFERDFHSIRIQSIYSHQLHLWCGRVVYIYLQAANR